MLVWYASLPSAQPVKSYFAARTCWSMYCDGVDMGRMLNADELSMPVQWSGFMTSFEGDTAYRINTH
jgi:hypothetical protein